jgi:hypothetical protein
MTAATPLGPLGRHQTARKWITAEVAIADALESGDDDVAIA